MQTNTTAVILKSLQILSRKQYLANNNFICIVGTPNRSLEENVYHSFRASLNICGIPFSAPRTDPPNSCHTLCMGMANQGLLQFSKSDTSLALQYVMVFMIDLCTFCEHLHRKHSICYTTSFMYLFNKHM